MVDRALTRPGARRANVLIIVTVVSLLIFAALFSLSYLTRTDIISSSNLLRELTATNIAESIATQCEARANTHLWTDRFWIQEAVNNQILPPYPPLYLNPDSPWVDLSREATPAQDYSFIGTIQDVIPSAANQDMGSLREYRLYLEVTVKSETYCFTFDKRHEGSLLATINWEQNKEVKFFSEQVPATQSSTEIVIEQIKKIADEAPPPDPTAGSSGGGGGGGGGAGSSCHDKLKKLKKHEKNFKARAFPGNPAKAPGPVTQTGNVVWLDPSGTSGAGVTPNGK